ncbi:unnamed protein product [Parascedosporium putredinis]|uniref:Putative transcription factor kapC n=1 Tax=Parascedosporium putredinis TaxID=1442378 RepID=A0A9P1GV39_9PEZI|nr:unnamed protein product [Parascedosporium putredinis]CAI7987646.1 unnamed protein product [Parascedosporium putredinis]
MATSASSAGLAPDAAELQASLELLRSHAASSPPGDNQSASAEAAAALSPHGYGDISAVANQQGRASVDPQVQAQQPKEEDYIHPDLRGPSSTIIPTANHLSPPATGIIPSSNLPLPPLPPVDVSSASIPDQQMLAPAPAPPVQVPLGQPEEPKDDAAGNRRGKRELSQSKRAAQNRAAQRAFRRRKEEYIKKLEERVGEVTRYEQAYRYLSSQNAIYREYVSAPQEVAQPEQTEQDDIDGQVAMQVDGLA